MLCPSYSYGSYRSYGGYAMTSNRMVHVRWLDSGLSYTDGWKTFDEIKSVAKLAHVDTVGFLFYEDEETLYIALSVHENSAYGVQLIARANIDSIRFIGENIGKEEYR